MLKDSSQVKPIMNAEAKRVHRHHWIGRGIFPDYSSDEEGDVDVSDDEVLHQETHLQGRRLPVAADERVMDAVRLRFRPREIITNVPGGKTVTATDYSMKWGKKDPMTTHELTFDEHNDFDKGFVYVSGMSVGRIARVSTADPRRQQIFKFPKSSQPHTLRFANVKSDTAHGVLWVGLEKEGKIVSLNMNKIFEKYGKMHPTKGRIPSRAVLEEIDYGSVCNVHIKADTIPCPGINTHPHGFCFDATYEYLWFTGKLTNTVGRIALNGDPKTLNHYQLPTLGAVPIYVALGPDKNVWGTCLANNMIFRVTTGANGILPGTVTEIPASHEGPGRRPIAIKPDPFGEQFMWFSAEAGHSVCRIDIEALEVSLKKQLETKQKKDGDTSTCVCSTGCKFLYKADPSTENVITEFAIPRVNDNMLLGGLAFDEEGTLWTQSYNNPTSNTTGLPDYIVRLGVDIHTRCHEHNSSTSPIACLTGVPIDFYQLPSKDTILHRITVGPDNRVWFTELGADRLGTIKIGTEEGASDHAAAAKKRKRSK